MNIKYDENSPSGLVWTAGRLSGNPAGTLNAAGYYEVQSKGKKHRAHRLVWELFNGPIPEGMVIDHINGNKADNRIQNLRLATVSQNNCNTRRAERQLPRGVYFTGSCYRGEVWKDGKRYMKKSSSLPVIRAWVEQTRAELHGEFARA